MSLATVTSKGQVTIPKAVRDILRLNSGDKIEFTVTKTGEAFIRPISRKVDELFGRLHKPGRKPVSTADMDEAIARRMEGGSQ
jgi:antitoxin PrlF